MALSNQSAAALNGAVVGVTLNASTGQGVTLPPNCRLVEVSCAAAFRAAIIDLDTTALTTANSLYYAADIVHQIWVGGVQPGGQAQSTLPAASRVLTLQAASGTPVASMAFRT